LLIFERQKLIFKLVGDSSYFLAWLVSAYEYFKLTEAGDGYVVEVRGLNACLIELVQCLAGQRLVVRLNLKLPVVELATGGNP
jgi:hypothetical protein